MPSTLNSSFTPPYFSSWCQPLLFVSMHNSQSSFSIHNCWRALQWRVDTIFCRNRKNAYPARSVRMKEPASSREIERLREKEREHEVSFECVLFYVPISWFFQSILQETLLSMERECLALREENLAYLATCYKIATQRYWRHFSDAPRMAYPNSNRRNRRRNVRSSFSYKERSLKTNIMNRKGVVYFKI